MVEEFKKFNLGDLIEIKHGYAFKGEYFADDGSHIVLTPGNFYEEGGFKKKDQEKWYTGDIPKDYILNENDLIVAMTEQAEGLLGSSALVPNENLYLHNQRLGLVDIVDQSLLDKKYLYYLFNTHIIREQIKATASGTKVRHTSPSRIYEADVEIPSLDTQQKIASILSAFDDLIENNTRRIAILEEMARLIYREWFVHYKYPGHENDRLVDSGTELGEVPEGWGVGTVGDLYDVKSGFAFKSKKLVDQGSFGVIKIGNIQSGDIDVEGVQFIENDEIPDRASKFKLHPGDVLIAMTGAKVGKVGIMPKTKNPYYLNQRVGKYFGKNELLKSHLYLYTFLNSREAQANIEHLAQGAAQPNISATDLKSLKLPIPPEMILNEYEELTLPMRDEMLTLRQKNVKLKETRDLLLPKLISGKIDVENITAN